MVSFRQCPATEERRRSGEEAETTTTSSTTGNGLLSRGWSFASWWYGGDEEVIDIITSNIPPEELEKIKNAAIKRGIDRYLPLIILIDSAVFGVGYYVGKSYGRGKKKRNYK